MNTMKTTKHILSYVLFTLFISCRPHDAEKGVSITDSNTIQHQEKDKRSLERSKRTKVEEDENSFEVALDKILAEALEIAAQNRDKGKFRKEYQACLDSICYIKVGINLDFHFTTSSPHLIIRRKAPDAIHIDVYALKEHKFEKVVSHSESHITYMNDTIRDINGDQLNDFVVNWYGSSGCCLKAFSNIYLIRSDRQTFTDSFEFINPTFSPKEKIIRGVCYGHPGETDMYKYRWNGEKVDTLEYIYFEKNSKGVKTGKIIVAKHREHHDEPQNTKRLNAVPKEYRNIDGFDWFMGIGY